MNAEKKLFAFRLAEKQAGNASANDGKWKARDGVAIAGCTTPTLVSPLCVPLSMSSDTNIPC